MLKDPRNALDRGPAALRPELGQRQRELRHIPVAARPVLFETLQDDPFQLGGHVRSHRPQRLGRVLTILMTTSGKVSPAKGTRPGEQLVQDDAERPDVGARVDVARRRICSGDM